MCMCVCVSVCVCVYEEESAERERERERGVEMHACNISDNRLCVHSCIAVCVYVFNSTPVSFESFSQVKQECDNEETDGANVYEQVIASLSKQIEDLSLSMDSLRQSDQNLSLSLRMAEQRAMEAETKLRHALDR